MIHPGSSDSASICALARNDIILQLLNQNQALSHIYSASEAISNDSLGFTLMKLVQNFLDLVSLWDGSSLANQLRQRSLWGAGSPRPGCAALESKR